ncbi:DUF2441 domain-containing protein [Bdellovibrio bacteriovorus]|uniref:DUF2441 domain-containing protein n=1 Tax=Bdellovibrio bacteriovorus TaxID=959 RepID=UPI00059F2CC2|nr:DUF2441 domain-containing protein [Bdellovibrio bacteriovorus]
MLKLYSAHNDLRLVAREAIFEQIRVLNYQNKPSRWDSIFLCEDKTIAERFRIEGQRGFDILYKVEILDKKAAYHRGDWNMNFTQADSVASMFQRAQEYWAATNVNNPEIVTQSAVRIIGRC